MVSTSPLLICHGLKPQSPRSSSRAVEAKLGGPDRADIGIFGSIITAEASVGRQLVGLVSLDTLQFRRGGGNHCGHRLHRQASFCSCQGDRQRTCLCLLEGLAA